MKLVSLNIIKANTCNGLLDGLSIPFRSSKAEYTSFNPICLIGPNGTGKSQVLQVIAEIFQAIFHRYVHDEESGVPNNDLEFEIEYLINDVNKQGNEKLVRFTRKSSGKKKADIMAHLWDKEVWKVLKDNEVLSLLPAKVVGYTSGDNETLSVPFFVSRAGYAKKVRTGAFNKKTNVIPDSRMLLIDYGTNLEVLVANLLLNPEYVRKELLRGPNLKRLRSFRCVIQLNHPAAPGGNDGIRLTIELHKYIDYLKSCASCYQIDESRWIHTFDFFVTDASHKAFEHYWEDGALDLYSCFHKLAMLNDLIIPKTARDSFKRGVENRRFASRLPEPFEEDKVFRFERVEFVSEKNENAVDYVSLSDGEHQLTQLLGTMCMAASPNILFLLDEAESHFNPKWRVEFISKLLNLQTRSGSRADGSEISQQECLISTHAPFVPSDMQRENVIIFSKDQESGVVRTRRPAIQTYGSKFDTILAECFDIMPPISGLPRDYVNRLLEHGNAEEISKAIAQLGESTARMKLAARLAQLEEGNK